MCMCVRPVPANNRIYILRNLISFHVSLLSTSLKTLKVIETAELVGMAFNGPDRRSWKISCNPDVVIYCD